MQIALLDYTDVKVVYDRNKVKREVLIPYEKFQAIAEFLERHAYFYGQEVQGRLQKSEEDLKTGRYLAVGGDEVDKALEWLHG